MVFLKRVIGLPGERVRIDRGQVFVDGRPLSEPYLRFGDTQSVPETTVPPRPTTCWATTGATATTRATGGRWRAIRSSAAR